MNKIGLELRRMTKSEVSVYATIIPAGRRYVNALVFIHNKITQKSIRQSRRVVIILTPTFIDGRARYIAAITKKKRYEPGRNGSWTEGEIRVKHWDIVSLYL